MSKPLISIITVVYNGAATLEATIRSVREQSWKNIEYIIVDGGSKDGTMSLVEKHRDAVAKWISEPDKGVYDAMNKGIRMAMGDWLYFLGSDDLLHDPGVLERLFDTPFDGDCDLLYGNVTSPAYKGPYDGEFTLEKLLSKNISHQAAFYRRELFQRLGDYDLRYRLHADWDFNLRCFMAEGVRTRYADVLVAEFGAEGMSSSHDIPFLRGRLIPVKLQWLNRQGVRALRRVAVYDEWWRFLRNAGFRKEAELKAVAGAVPVPTPILRMIRWQRPIPPALLRNGFVSKGWMFISYLFNR
jgi:glycosyltransferase involved in cell wall biosynthesis